MSTVLLDTVGLVALWNRSDQWHTVATQAFQEIVYHFSAAGFSTLF